VKFKFSSRQVEIRPGVMVTYTVQDAATSRSNAEKLKQKGDTVGAANVLRYAEMIESVLNGGDYYYTGE